MIYKLLIIEQENSINQLIIQQDKFKDAQIELADSIESAKRIIDDDDFSPHVILIDLTNFDQDVLKYIQDLQAYVEYAQWIFIIHNDSDAEKDNIEDLCYDYLEKPIKKGRLDLVIKRASRSAMTSQRLMNYDNAYFKKYHIEAYLGSSRSVRELKSLLKKLCNVPLSSMIISGETGTGKGLVARIVHHSGLRKAGPLIELNCAALPKDLLESELFGHEAGAFTGAQQRRRGLMEQANGGTLFLDEIGDMDIELQAKLLKALEDKMIRRLGGGKEIQIDVQIIAATGIDLDESIYNGNFRDDLYHRLSVFHVSLPPLRNRKDDLVELVPRIIAEYNRKATKNIEVVPDEVWEQLFAYDWPGNIRELRNVLERCVLLSSGKDLTARWLQLSTDNGLLQKLQTSEQQNIDNNMLNIPLDGSMSLEDMDSYIIKRALELNDFNVSETAKVLQTTRETLRYRIQKYKIMIND